MGYGLWVMGYGLWVMGYGLWVVGCGLWVVGCGLCVVRWALGPHPNPLPAGEGTVRCDPEVQREIQIRAPSAPSPAGLRHCTINPLSRLRERAGVRGKPHRLPLTTPAPP